MVNKLKDLPVNEGDLLADKYRVHRVLGSGGMGVVVAAVHLDLGEMRAIKLLLPEHGSSAETVERFMREARAVARLRNAHVARVYDVGRLATAEPYIVMEYLEGEDLKALQKLRGWPFAVEEAASHIMHALEGIAEAHAVGIVHRDLKPSNLFLTEDADGQPSIKVLDFGISKVSAELATGSAEMTETNSMLGTPLFMSPEQMRSAKDVDRRTDIWSLGVILYKLLTGRTPFKGDGVTSICLDVIETKPVPPSTLNAQIPAAVEAIVLCCLEKNRDRRYQNALELATALAPLAGPQAQVSLRRIERWHHSPPAATSAPTFSSLSARSSSAGVGAVALETPGSGSGLDPGAVRGADTAASWERSDTLALASTRTRRRLAIAGASIGVVGLALVLVLALGAPPEGNRSADGSAAARDANPPEMPARDEALDELTTTSAPAKTASSATDPDDPIADGGTKPDRKTAQPIAPPAKPKSAQPNPKTGDTDPFGKGRR
ncbi:MAG: serine/threonine protein kinase [Deltaproteobacteria bacterium]|nr:MAG: serine/threonine protein kinase [Deltaproteobacteria bacterium]